MYKNGKVTLFKNLFVTYVVLVILVQPNYLANISRLQKKNLLEMESFFTVNLTRLPSFLNEHFPKEYQVLIYSYYIGVNYSIMVSGRGGEGHFNPWHCFALPIGHFFSLKLEIFFKHQTGIFSLK